MHVVGPGWWFPFFPLLGVLFWVLVIAALVVLIRRPSRRHPTDEPWRSTPSSALRILEERYARGEITREEFHERRAVLTGEPPPAPPPPPASGTPPATPTG